MNTNIKLPRIIEKPIMDLHEKLKEIVNRERERLESCPTHWELEKQLWKKNWKYNLFIIPLLAHPFISVYKHCRLGFEHKESEISSIARRIILHFETEALWINSQKGPGQKITHFSLTERDIYTLRDSYLYQEYTYKQNKVLAILNESLRVIQNRSVEVVFNI